ncbi:MAG TPA: redoxin family protein [Candidatus Binataceae bacterium]|nr:redoxin family protein [Candidatus Binataceae bacterium]
MPQINETIFAPELDGGEWLQGGPLRLGEQRGRAVVLIDFWDYTCVNCIRSLPYVVGWDRRYREAGLVVVGVHAPEFTFAREHGNVREAVARFGIEYPVVLDNGYAIWRAFSNRCWPAKYLVDAHGRIRYYHFGEGAYHDSERAIQRALAELNPRFSAPPLMAPVRDTDRPGALCYRVTPELYLGYARGQFGNPGGVVHDRAHDYADPGHHAEGIAYLGGRWIVGAESAGAGAAGASLALRYTGKDVNLVMAPPAQGPVRVELKLDADQRPGEDARPDSGMLLITVDRPRMYNLVANESVSAGALTLRAREPGLGAYAFTFVSCATE